MRIAIDSILMISSKSMQILLSVLGQDADCNVYGMDAGPRSNILHPAQEPDADCNAFMNRSSRQSSLNFVGEPGTRKWRHYISGSKAIWTDY